MQKNIEKQLEQFVRGQIAGIHRIQMTNGTMYLVLDKPSLCDFVHKEIRTFYKYNINRRSVSFYKVHTFSIPVLLELV